MTKGQKRFNIILGFVFLVAFLTFFWWQKRDSICLSLFCYIDILYIFWYNKRKRGIKILVLVTVKEFNSGVGAVVFMEQSHSKGGSTFMRACTEALKRSTQNDAVFSVYENKKKMISYQNGKMK